MSKSLHDEALDILQSLTRNADAQFRDGQFEAIEALVEHRRRALVVQRTGWGKSAVYFVAGLLRRQRDGVGPTVIISPLLALMRDQIAAAERAGVRAVAINSSNVTEWDDISARLAAGDVDVLLVSPERLNNPAFVENQLPALVAAMGLLVIDEAHCISDWGHDFRPDYRRIRDLIATLPAGVPILATTATANSRVVDDVAEQLGVGNPDGAGGGLGGNGASDVFVVRGPLARDSLRLGVLELQTSRQRLGWLLAHLDELPGSGIIYTLTVSAAEDTARLLREHGHQVTAYTGRTDTAEREQAEEDLKDNRAKALVATSALGMGFDKPDLGFVVHLGAPSSAVAYYQQVGRAGRGVANADVLLLPGTEDRDIWRYFATSSMPTRASTSAVLTALAEADRPLSTPALEARVDLRRSPLELLLKVLSVDGAVAKVKGGWATTGVPWHYDAERYQRVSEARVAEQEAMLQYERGSSCRMEFLARQLDDETAHPCGRCDNCLATRGEPAWYPTDVPTNWADAADGQLAKVGVPVEPRAQWPTGMDQVGINVKGKIGADELSSTGRVIARLTDLGHGQQLRALFAPGPDGAAVDSELDPSLAGACVEVLKEWDWQQRPVAVVGIPSTSRPELVRSLVDGLARVGRLTNLGMLELDPSTTPVQGNSVFRLASVWHRFAVPASMDPADAGGPILLVDDLIDSRWTMTVCARLLRRAGASEVLPFALGQQA